MGLLAEQWTEKHARLALRAAKAAIKDKRRKPWPAWAIQAQAAGWKPPAEELEAVMPEPIHCDGCGAIAPRPLAYPCPSGWWYIKAADEGGEGDFYVYACSIACRQSLWVAGPGDRLADADAILAVLKAKEVT